MFSHSVGGYEDCCGYPYGPWYGERPFWIDAMEMYIREETFLVGYHLVR